MIRICWHFADEDIEGLPGSFTLPPSSGMADLAPALHDLVSFDGLDERFMVIARRMHYLRTAPGAAAPQAELHVHLVYPPSARDRT